MGRRTLRTGTRFEQLASYSRAVRVGSRIVVSATAALDDEGAALSVDPYEQARRALRTAVGAVEELGGTREGVIRTRLYLAAGADWEGPVKAHGEMFEGVNPANTTLFVHGFIPDDVVVEVELEAEI